MGYVFEFKDSVAYENWLRDDLNQAIVKLENRLMSEMVQPVVGDSLIDIGCGTGVSLEPFMGKGVQLTGVDPSPYMLDIAREKVGHRADFHRAYAEDLPFDDNSFNYACLSLTLEFCEDPEKAVAEACRVAKDGVFVGILNKHSLMTIRRRIRRIFKATIYDRARFFSVGEIKSMFFSLLGNVPVTSRTVCQLPRITHPLIVRIESLPVVQQCPFGAFAGIMAVPVARFRTMPLTLASPASPAAASGSPATSCAGGLKNNFKLGTKHCEKYKEK